MRTVPGSTYLSPICVEKQGSGPSKTTLVPAEDQVVELLLVMMLTMGSELGEASGEGWGEREACWQWLVFQPPSLSPAHGGALEAARTGNCWSSPRVPLCALNVALPVWPPGSFVTERKDFRGCWESRRRLKKVHENQAVCGCSPPVVLDADLPVTPRAVQRELLKQKRHF